VVDLEIGVNLVAADAVLRHQDPCAGRGGGNGAGRRWGVHAARR
jgi:hypothetical protein